MELFNNTECSKVQANHPLIALHFYSQFIFISSLFRSIYFHLAFPLLCPFSFARLRVTLWLRVLFGLFYCFSQLYVHSLLPGSVFLSGFRRILDLFTVFLCFMSIFSCPIPYFSLASGEFWTFFLFFSALCPFSPARFRISFWLQENFGLFSWFSRLYIHMEEYRSLKTAMNSEGSGLQRVRKSQDCDEFGCLRTSMSSEGSRLR